MKLTGFRVYDYRSVLDSEWIEVSDFTVLMGKNESGKTGLLKALHKLKPYRPEPFDISREWPKKRWSERNPQKIAITGRFALDEEDLAQLSILGGWNPEITAVEVSRRYDGQYEVAYVGGELNAYPNFEQLAESARAKFQSVKLDKVPGLTETFESALTHLAGGDHSAFTSQIGTLVSAQQEAEQPDAAQALRELQAEVSRKIKLQPAIGRADNIVTERMPNFIYMDDYRAATGNANLQHLWEKKQNNSADDDDKTLLMMMEMAGIRLQEEVKRCEATDQDSKDAQNQDIAAASESLTELMRGKWSQGKYRVDFRINGCAFNTYVKDEETPGLIWLEDRSKGFQWFFSFDLMFMYETKGTFSGAVILLDEPGLHLHIEAQRDLLKRLREYAVGNQLIYTSHLPFMIDPSRLDAIRFVQKDREVGTWVTDDVSRVDSQSKFPLQAAIGLTLGNSMIFGPHNLVVEGVTDQWFLEALSAACQEAALPSLDPSIIITPAGGATEAAYVATILKGQDLDVVVLLDSDPSGDQAYDRLVKRWLMEDRHVIRVGGSVGTPHAEIEDLFDPEFYLQFVNESYAKELQKKPLTAKDLATTRLPCIVDQVNAALIARGLPPNSEGVAYNKGRTAKRLVKALGSGAASAPEPTLKAFSALFEAINSAMLAVAGASK